MWRIFNMTFQYHHQHLLQLIQYLYCFELCLSFVFTLCCSMSFDEYQFEISALSGTKIRNKNDWKYKTRVEQSIAHLDCRLANRLEFYDMADDMFNGECKWNT